MNVEIKRVRESATIPAYHTSGSAAADIAACIDEPITLQPGDRHIVPTGFSMAIPAGYEAQLRPRSGLSSKHGIALANGVGTIDSDYRGEVGVILIHLGSEPFVVEPGMRIAQMAIVKCEQATWHIVDELNDTERGTSGYGSTGH